MPSRCLIIGTFDSFLAATRHDHVHVLRHRDQFADGGAVGGFDDLHRILRQAGAGQAFLHQLRQRLVAVDRFRAAAQDGCVAALDAQAGRIHRHVRTRFIDDADHAQRHAHLADLDASRAVFHVRNFTDRVGQCDDLFESLGHRCDRLVRQRQAVQHRFREAVGFRCVQVLAVRFAQRFRVTPNRCGDQCQRVILRPGICLCHCARSLAGALADVGHVVLDVHVSLSLQKVLNT